MERQHFSKVDKDNQYQTLQKYVYLLWISAENENEHI